MGLHVARHIQATGRVLKDKLINTRERPQIDHLVATIQHHRAAAVASERASVDGSCLRHRSAQVITSGLTQHHRACCSCRDVAQGRCRRIDDPHRSGRPVRCCQGSGQVDRAVVAIHQDSSASCIHRAPGARHADTRQADIATTRRDAVAAQRQDSTHRQNCRRTATGLHVTRHAQAARSVIERERTSARERSKTDHRVVAVQHHCAAGVSNHSACVDGSRLCHRST